MASIPVVITDAGIAEVINAENRGTAPVVLSHIGFGSGQYSATKTQTALKSEFKRLETSGGVSVADNVVHVSIHDSSADEYTVYEMGVFTESGTLFAVYSQSTPIIEKSSVSHALISLDVVLSNVNPESITVGETNFVLNSATTEREGVIELATANEVIAGSDALRAVTPAGLKALTGTTSRKGLVELATDSEAIAGKSTAVVMTAYTVQVAINDRIQNVGNERTRDSSQPNYGLN